MHLTVLKYICIDIFNVLPMTTAIPLIPERLNFHETLRSDEQGTKYEGISIAKYHYVLLQLVKKMM